MEFHEEHNFLKAEFEEELLKVFSHIVAPKEIIEAMSYSLFLDGKRLRPVIMLHMAKVLGLGKEIIVPFCCALEMIHTYSLIHDDLPAMDNDDIRRGKASNHKKFGEDIAILAGDGLLTFAFEMMLKNCSKENSYDYMKAILYTAECAGVCGMIGGQVLDVKNKAENIDQLKKMHTLKTGKLFEVAVMVPVILAHISQEDFIKYKQFSYNLGLLFQITDDILDVEGEESSLGKTVGKDLNDDKTTYVSFYGVNGAKQEADKIEQLCERYIRKTGYKQEYLTSLIKYVKQRKK